MRVLSGIQPSGRLHLGNYFGMMKPALELAQAGDAFLFNPYNVALDGPPANHNPIAGQPAFPGPRLRGSTNGAGLRKAYPFASDRAKKRPPASRPGSGRQQPPPFFGAAEVATAFTTSFGAGAAAAPVK